MNLLKAMLEKDPVKRISSREALSHDAFLIHLSKSPLIVKQFNDSEKLERFRALTEKNGLLPKKIPNVNIPDRIEDLSPLPAPKKQFKA